jgi:hypothetical protein
LKTTLELRLKWQQLVIQFKEKILEAKDALDEDDPLDSEELRSLAFLSGMCDRMLDMIEDLNELGA